jgi:hypothetical protein
MRGLAREKDLWSGYVARRIIASHGHLHRSRSFSEESLNVRPARPQARSGIRAELDV